MVQKLWKYLTGRSYLTPRKITNVENKFSKVQKIFSVYGYVVSGSGSLFILEYFRGLLGKGEYNFKNRYIVKSDFDFSDTNVYITKKSCGKNHCMEFKVKSEWLPFNYRLLKITKSVIRKRMVVSGSGAAFASGAIEAGATMDEAINIASKLDKFTDDRLQCVIL
ncbi:hypothetical protein TUST1-2_00815 [Vibrio phage ICP1_2001_A]|nr:hypothetical protein TUST1-2_00815 [Vibrio phage ICP1_2001_A]